MMHFMKLLNDTKAKEHFMWLLLPPLIVWAKGTRCISDGGRFCRVGEDVQERTCSWSLFSWQRGCVQKIHLWWWLSSSIRGGRAAENCDCDHGRKDAHGMVSGVCCLPCLGEAYVEK